MSRTTTPSKQEKGQGNRLPFSVSTKKVLSRNRQFEAAGLDHFLIRLPRIRAHAHFYYKYIESGECVVSEHGHRHWEVARVYLGAARYRPTGEEWFMPTASEYLIFPPRLVHEWQLLEAPLLLPSWMITLEPKTRRIRYQPGDKLLRFLEAL
jgi:hypothetical protein